MYESHFGLKNRPFGSKAEGAEVFTGPQQAKITKSLHKALAVPDGVVTLTGPVGVGKTTIVGKALESITPNRMAAWIGRMQLAPDEVLDLLLAGFGVRTKATGTIRRFAVFRRVLAERAAAGAPVTVVVEDAQRLGADTLVELEALTAADTGDATAANIILMGPELNTLLSEPDLARLKQRSRLRQKATPFGQAEVTGYLKHAIRHAGGEYDNIFGPGVDEIVFGCSEGIPRMINTLCASALETAMEEGEKHISATLMHQVAEETFGYEGPLPEPTPAAAPAAPEPKQQPEPAAATTAQPDPANAEDAEIDWEAPPVVENTDKAPAENDPSEINEEDLPPAARNIVVESGYYPALPEIPEQSPLAEADETENEAEPIVANSDIPELIEDTQPELSTLPIPEPESPAPNALAEATGSTSILEKPEGIELAAAAAESDDAADDSGNFDLDAALSIETDATNVMEGITPNLDKLASQGEAHAPSQEADEPKTAPSVDDLPTLSNSMRIDVKKEVKRARQVEASTEPAPKPESNPEPVTAPEPKPAPQAEAKAKPEPEPEPDPELPMVLEPEPEMVAEMPSEPEPEPVPEPKAAPQSSEMTARIAALDPANRTNDVDALEAALDAAKKGKLDDLMAPPSMPSISATAAGRAEEEAPVPVPEITLDDTLAEAQKLKPISLEAAAEISKANSLEEFSDTMAETLFGNEDLDAIAAEVIANPPSEGYIAGEEPLESSPVQLEEPPQPEPADELVALQLDDKPDSLPTPPPADRQLRDSQSMRADMLKSMQPNGHATPSEHVEIAHDPVGVTPPSSNGTKPESIENQINTSMTQTLEALNVAKIADSLVDEDDEKPAKKSGGFFSRFRKSS